MDEESSLYSFNLSFTLPHIAETLNKFYMQGICLNSYLRSKFELCYVEHINQTYKKHRSIKLCSKILVLLYHGNYIFLS